MVSDYDTICKENILNYGRETRHLEFLGRLYSDRTHFVYELLQNAEDARARRVEITLYSDRLEVFHDGKLFDEADVRGICGVGEGTKPDDLTNIGKFGIGFKSVYAFTSTPEIHCGDEHFGIRNYVRPYAIDPIEVLHPWTTRFLFPLDSPLISSVDTFNEIAERLKSLNIRTLLFLKSIEEITWNIDGGTSGIYFRETQIKSSTRFVNVIGETADELDEESWLVFQRAITAPDGMQVSPVEIAFLLDSEPELNGKKEIAVTYDSPLFVYFATEKDTKLGFLIQGPYKTTPARDNIPRDDPWNWFLLKETAELVVDSLEHLKVMKILSVPLLQSLPIREENFLQDSMFRPLYDRVATALMEEEFIPTLGGGFVSGCNAIIGRGEEIRDLLCSEQLLSLFGDSMEESDRNEPRNLEWLSELITQDRTLELRNYLMIELNIEEVTPEIFARRVDCRFLSAQTDEWMVRLYKFLGQHEALWRSSVSRRATGLIRQKKFVRLEDGRQVSAFDEDGSVAVYLPHHGTRQLPTVKSELLKDPAVAEFFSRLGIHEPDVVAEVLKHVIPLYELDERDVSDKDHREHIDLIMQALKVDSTERRKTFVSKMKEIRFLFGINAHSGEIARKLPRELYVKSPGLSVYLERNPAAWFLDSRYGDDEIKTFLAFGCSDSSRIRGKQADREGNVTICEQRGWHMRGLDDFDPDFSVDHLEFALQNLTANRSLFIWQNIAGPLQRKIRGRVETATRQYYENSKIECMVSTLGKLLLSKSWLPDSSGQFYKPAEISLSDLPHDFNRNESLAAQLGMKDNELATIANRSGFEIADLDFLRDLKKMPEQFEIAKEMVTRVKNKPSFPELPSANSERRAEYAKQDAGDAPSKEYEKRIRRVRTSVPLGDKNTYLKENYTNGEEQLVCQMCEDEMPFRRRDGEYYFESVQLLDNLSGEHTAAHLALCPLCAAKYKELVKRDAEITAAFYKKISALVGLVVETELGQEVGSIRFVERHLLDIQGILKEETNLD